MGTGRYQAGGGGLLLLTTGPIINGLVVSGRVNDPFAFILVLGGN